MVSGHKFNLGINSMKSFSPFKSLRILLLSLSLMAPVFANAQQSEDIIGDSIKDITTVAVMGATGAVLGLSTLSFVEEPKDHLKNILIGGALGIIIGVGFVAYNQANQSKQVIRGGAMVPSLKDMPTADRKSWHQASLSETIARPSFVPASEITPVNMTFSF